VCCHASQAPCIVLDGLTIIKRGEVELPTQLLCIAFFTRLSLTLMVAIASQASFAVFILAIVGTISGGTAPHNASSTIISSC
jgi:hypothetical protein